MDLIAEKKDALAAVGLTALGFVLLVFSTTSNQYGMLLMPSDRLIWSVTRVLPVLCWVSVAGLLVLFRDQLFWSSAAASFMSSLVIGCMAAVAISPGGIDPSSVVASVTYYALISAVLCFSVKSKLWAIILGPLLVAAQVFLDVITHLGSGVLQLAI